MTLLELAAKEQCVRIWRELDLPRRVALRLVGDTHRRLQTLLLLLLLLPLLLLLQVLQVLLLLLPLLLLLLLPLVLVLVLPLLVLLLVGTHPRVDWNRGRLLRLERRLVRRRLLTATVDDRHMPRRRWQARWCLVASAATHDVPSQAQFSVARPGAASTRTLLLLLRRRRRRLLPWAGGRRRPCRCFGAQLARHQAMGLAGEGVDTFARCGGRGGAEARGDA